MIDRALLILCLALVAALLFAFFRTGREPTHSPEARRELAEERIEKIETRAKSERRAARARVDREVQDAAATGDLVDFLDSRAPN